MENQVVNEKKSMSTSTIINIVLGVVLVILLILGAVFGNFTSVSKDELKKEYIKKSELSFYDLPAKVQDEFISKSRHEQLLEYTKNDYENKDYAQTLKMKELLVDKLKNTNKLLEEEIASLKKANQNNTKVVYKEDEVKVKELENKISSLEKELKLANEKKADIKDMFTPAKEKEVKKIHVENTIPENVVEKKSSHYAILKCYDTPKASFYLTNDCHENIKTFISQNREAKMFEVIGVTDKNDFTIIDTLVKRTPMELSDEDRKRVRDYSDLSLGRYRVIQATWQIKESVGDGILVAPVNYTIHSKKDNRGVVIRAYK